MIFAVDFDGTVVDHRYPDVGRDVPGAVEVLREMVAAGHRIVLFTMRADGGADGDVLAQAVRWFADRDIPLWGVNANPEQRDWTASPKAYAQVYIDDAALGCPLRPNPRMGGRPFVDWPAVRRWIADRGWLP